jgi:hypothetical protein
VSIGFHADAELDGAIVRGVRHREPSIDFMRANDAALEGEMATAGCEPLKNIDTRRFTAARNP